MDVEPQERVPHHIRGIACGRDHIYLLESNLNAIWSLDPSTHTARWLHHQADELVDICVAPGGDLAVHYFELNVEKLGTLSRGKLVEVAALIP